MDVKGRKSIHGEKNQIEECEVEGLHLLQCGTCSEYFLTGEDGARKKIDSKKLTELKKKNVKTYPDLTHTAPFNCSSCESLSNSEHNQKHQSPINGQPWRMSRNWKSVSFGVLSLLILFCAMGYDSFIPSSKNTERPFNVNKLKKTEAEEALDSELYSLEEKYSKQEDKVWYSLAAGIKLVLKSNPHRPSVFLMLYDNELAGTTAKCLTQDVGQLATKFLKKQSNRPVIINGAELAEGILINDPGLLLIGVNDTVRRKGALFVVDLQDVPPKVATSFHFICDSYSPLIETAVIFFTLKVDGFSTLKLTKIAEDRLRALWSHEMGEDKLQPLITRMTSNVIKILSDFSSCPEITTDFKTVKTYFN